MHPTIAAMLLRAQQAGVPALSAGTPDDARALMTSITATLGPGVPVGSRTELRIPTRGGEVAGLLLMPEERPAGLVAYLHGGGWVIGTPEDFETLCRSLVARSGCAVLLPNYRLAPEHPFPAALEDCEDAVLWACRERQRLLGHDAPVVAAGDSAGANLAAVVSQTLRHEAGLAGQALVYPVTDAGFDTRSYHAYGTGYPLSQQDMEWFFGHYAPRGLWSDPRIAPLQAASLDGLAPAVVVTAECDVLRDEGEAYAGRLRAAGGTVTHRRYAGMTHGFLRLHGVVDTADLAVTELAADLRALCGAKSRKKTAPSPGTVLHRDVTGG